MSTKLAIDPVIVGERVELFLVEADVEFAPMDAGTAALSVQASADYGKGRGHPAQLNLADCLSYACAKAASVPRLYKGKDFSHTDLA